MGCRERALISLICSLWFRWTLTALGTTWPFVSIITAIDTGFCRCKLCCCFDLWTLFISNYVSNRCRFKYDECLFCVSPHVLRPICNLPYRSFTLCELLLIFWAAIQKSQESVSKVHLWIRFDFSRSLVAVHLVLQSKAVKKNYHVLRIHSSGLP